MYYGNLCQNLLLAKLKIIKTNNIYKCSDTYWAYIHELDDIFFFCFLYQSVRLRCMIRFKFRVNFQMQNSDKKYQILFSP